MVKIKKGLVLGVLFGLMSVLSLVVGAPPIEPEVPLIASPGVMIIPPADTIQQSLKDVLQVATQENDAPTVLVALKLMGDDATSRDSTEFKNYDLCVISIKDTNLFCQKNKGIPRIKMPQFIGKPVSGTQADALPRNAKGEVDATAQFIQYVKDKGYLVGDPEIVAASKLKATQTELEGKKVAGMWWALEQDPNNPGITAPIFISQDNYVIDGHHRWAAIVGTAFKNKRLNEVTMQARRLNLPISKIVTPEGGGLANDFVNEFGILQESAGKTP